MERNERQTCTMMDSIDAADEQYVEPFCCQYDLGSVTTFVSLFFFPLTLLSSILPVTVDAPVWRSCYRGHGALT